MKNNMLLQLVLLLTLFSACKQIENQESLAFDQAIESSKIKAVLMDQQEAWNAFDIPKFMEGYWKSEKLSFIGSRGITRGWQQTLDNYIKSYPDPAAMGKLDFEVIQLDVLSAEHAIMIGRYTLFREKDTPTGLFTLRWNKIDGDWKIVSDQTCG